jgi:hypothetical protein
MDQSEFKSSNKEFNEEEDFMWYIGTDSYEVNRCILLFKGYWLEYDELLLEMSKK